MAAPFWELAAKSANPRDAQNALWLQPGLHVQAYDATLTSLAGLSVVQGNLLYGSAADTLALLAKDANATRYLSNQGTSNNPSWNQVNLADGVTGTLPVANGGTGDTGTAWTSYTPTITASSGTFTSVSAAGRYKTLGKTTWIHIEITITTNNTAAVAAKATLPSTPNNGTIFHGRGVLVSGKMLQGQTSGSIVFITNYDGTYPGADGEKLVIDGTYEAA